MTRDDQQHWDDKWSRRPAEKRPAVCALLIKYLGRVPERGRALDVACGLGQNAIWLAQHGFQVDGVDISRVALARARACAEQAGVQVNFFQVDLDEYAPLPDAYAVIVVRRFLHRRLWPALRQALASGGWLFYETYNLRKQIAEREFPAAYLLADGELLRAFGDLDVIEAGDDGGEHGEVSWIVACKGRVK